jgi:hypothetical protein
LCESEIDANPIGVSVKETNELYNRFPLTLMSMSTYGCMPVITKHMSTYLIHWDRVGGGNTLSLNSKQTGTGKFS